MQANIGVEVINSVNWDFFFLGGGGGFCKIIIFNVIYAKMNTVSGGVGNSPLSPPPWLLLWTQSSRRFQ